MEKGYWEDSHRLEFEGVVTQATETEQGVLVRFEKTFFYPESGGQLADGGTVDGIAILDARQDDLGPYVLLRAGTPITRGSHVRCLIDPEKRGSHTQLHSVQHILSRLLDERGIATLSFHMTEDDASIEVDMPSIDGEMLQEIEDAVERVIWQCLPVETVFTDVSSLEAYDVRKVPELAGGPLRLVQIGALDTNPCGGTHVANTGEIGGFAIVRTDKVRGNVRLYFVAGRTATKYRRRTNAVLAEIEKLLTCGLGDIPASISKMQQRDRDAGRQLKELQSIAIDHLADQAQRQIAEDGYAAVILEQVPSELGRALMARLNAAAGPVCIVVYPVGGSDGQFICSVPVGSEVLLRLFSSRMKERFGARLGGSGTIVQGKIETRLTRDELVSVLTA